MSSLTFDPSVLHLSELALEDHEEWTEEVASEANRAADLIMELRKVLHGKTDDKDLADLKDAAQVLIRLANKLED